MAFKSKDGKRNFGNRQQANAYDQRGAAPAGKENDQTMQDESDESAGDEQSQMDIQDHVAENGPADKVEITHAEGRHTKTSHHGGKKHVSHHDSAEEAHEHGKIAAGVGHQEPDGDEAPAMAGDGAIPGM
jgi:hypothetical protein